MLLEERGEWTLTYRAQGRGREPGEEAGDSKVHVTSLLPCHLAHVLLPSRTILPLDLSR